MEKIVENESLELMKEKTKGSYEAFLNSQQYMPGGVTANIKYFEPYPLFMKEAEGAWLIDVDGNQYVDYLLAYGALILGHGHHHINKAVMKQLLTKGTTIFGTPHELEIEMAKQIQTLYPSMELVRYTNSGTEATLLATRIAYAYTNKYKIAKFEGHYHGGFDSVLLSVNPPIAEAGTSASPKSVPDSSGISNYYKEHTIILPFNDLEASEALLRKHAHELAAIILEPVQAGYIPGELEFMRGIRRLSEELGIILIFDEVKTGFRITLGGAQEIYGIKPDLTALGKVLGGGFPVGAVGGKKEIMEVCSPLGKKDLFEMTSTGANKSDILFHSGTYNGHPLILAAGLATINVLISNQHYQTLLNNTSRLRKGIEHILQHYEVKGTTIGMGTIFNIILGQKEVKNYRQLQTINTSLRKELDYRLLALGVYTKPLNRFSLSLAHKDREIQHTLDAFEVAIKQLRERKGSSLIESSGNLRTNHSKNT